MATPGSAAIAASSTMRSLVSGATRSRIRHRAERPWRRSARLCAAFDDIVATFPAKRVLVAALCLVLPREHASLSAALTLLAWVALTGGLHLVGLADSADAWVSGFDDRERTREIMKDPRSGPAGVTPVVLLLLLKFAALASLAAENAWLLWLSPLLARTVLAAAFVTTPCMRSGDLGSGLKDAPRVACVFALALDAALLLFVLWRRASLSRLGGVTGDAAGARRRWWRWVCRSRWRMPDAGVAAIGCYA